MQMSDQRLTNADLAPVPESGRTWSKWHLAALWIGMSVCIPTYMLAAGMIKAGMNWWQAVLTVMLGNLIVTVPMILNGHGGTKYGIP
ncbi:MAG: nitrate reductase, partial [Phycisphaeraceae bacterium]|nr:nitrate reductase [Phycisphaeraceae bacterium]